MLTSRLRIQGLDTDCWLGFVGSGVSPDYVICTELAHYMDDMGAVSVISPCPFDIPSDLIDSLPISYGIFMCDEYHIAFRKIVIALALSEASRIHYRAVKAGPSAACPCLLPLDLYIIEISLLIPGPDIQLR